MAAAIKAAFLPNFGLLVCKQDGRGGGKLRESLSQLLVHEMSEPVWAFGDTHTEIWEVRGLGNPSCRLGSMLAADELF